MKIFHFFDSDRTLEFPEAASFMQCYSDYIEIICPNNVQADLSGLTILDSQKQP